MFLWQKSLTYYRDQTGVRIATMSTGDGCTNDWPAYPPFRCALYATYLFGFDAFGFTYPEYSISGPGTDRLCALPPFPDAGTMYLGPPTAITTSSALTFSRSTNKGTLYVFGDANGPDICDGAFLSKVYLPLIFKPEGSG